MDPTLSEMDADLRQTPELDLCAHRIADSAAHQAGPVACCKV